MALKVLDITRLLDGLARERPVFHSEADFQFALAWRIKKATSHDVRLEFKPFPAERMHLDMWLPGIGTAVELKYLTRKLDVERDGESFALRDQGAEDLGRYDFLNDLQRLERVVAKAPYERRGIAVLLTNDPLYWKPPYRRGTVDAEFRLHEDRKLPGEMCWSKRAGKGTTAGRNSPIRLCGSYRLKWRDYGSPVREAAETKNAQFRYLALPIRR